MKQKTKIEKVDWKKVNIELLEIIEDILNNYTWKNTDNRRKLYELKNKLTK